MKSETLHESPISVSTLPSRLFAFTSLAALFRRLGVASVCIAAFIFMIQGIEDVSLDLRQWTWISLISMMGIVGYLCRNVLDEIKGARIFFILALALIPVQFSQLGGSIFDAFSLSDQVTNFWTGTHVFSSLPFIKILLSFFLASVFAYTTFSILARGAGAPLTLLFVATNLLMLLSFRDSLYALLVIITMIGVVSFAEQFFCKPRIAFRTLDGKIVRSLLMLPIAIVFVRNSMHLSSISGISAMVGILSMLFIYQLPSWFDQVWLRNLSKNFGGALGVSSWLLFAQEFSLPYKEFIVALPLVALCLELRRCVASSQQFWSNTACLVFALLGLYVLVFNLSVNTAFVLLCASIVFLVAALCLKLKLPLYVSSLSLIGSTLAIVTVSLTYTNIGTWLMFAVGGVLLVLLSSLVERYGKGALHYLSRVKEFGY